MEGYHGTRITERGSIIGSKRARNVGGLEGVMNEMG